MKQTRYKNPHEMMADMLLINYIAQGLHIPEPEFSVDENQWVFKEIGSCVTPELLQDIRGDIDRQNELMSCLYDDVVVSDYWRYRLVN